MTKKKTGFYDEVDQKVDSNIYQTSVLENIIQSRNAITLNEVECELIASYRTLNLRAKAKVLGFIEDIIPEQGHHMVLSDRVGQQVTGNITAPQTFNLVSKKENKAYENNLIKIRKIVMR